VREIAQRHGGTAAVLAARPHGLRVQLRLPPADGSHPMH